MTDDLFWPRPDEPETATEPLARPRPSRWQQRDWRLPAVAAGSALVFGGAGVGIGAAVAGGSGGNGADTVSSGFKVATTSATAPAPKSYAAIASRVLPSVVSINVTGQAQQDTGSGIILRSDGYILTNNHVVSAATSGGSVSVVFNDGRSATARIVGTDQEDDLAVLKVARTGLPAATLGSSSGVHVGDPVLAVGSPLGLSGTVTAGIVSALDRPVDTTADQQSINPFDPQSAPTTTTVINAIQTDAAINPGNSGGPLVNASGAVIGINSAIASTGNSIGGQAGNIGVGFAIPIDQAQVIAQELISTGHASHPLLGVSLADATGSSGVALARVQAVTAGGPADRAGIQVGDIIVSIGGQQTQGADAVIAAIRSHQPGDSVKVVVTRNGVRHTFQVTLVDAAQASG
jgi:putative serine protease PepD